MPQLQERLTQPIDTPAPILPAAEPPYQGANLGQLGISERLLMAGGSIGFGVLVITIAVLSIQSRIKYITIDNAIINARTIDLQATVEGDITSFKAQAGETIKKGQVIAAIKPIETEDSNTVKLQGEIDLLIAQKTQTLETHSLLKEQLASLEKQTKKLTEQQQQLSNYNRSTKLAKVKAAKIGLDQQKAQIASAIAKSTAAKLEYERYTALAVEGVLSRQKAEQAKAVWQIMEAEVTQAKAALAAAEAESNALEQATPEVIPLSTPEQSITLSQNLQAQSAKIKTLTAEIANKQVELKRYQSDRLKKNQVKAIKAPVGGVIYRTTANIGESVNRNTPMMTVLDCQSRWIEALVPASQAHRIDRQQPVGVTVAGQKKAILGQVKSIRGVNSEALKRQPQAIVPTTPDNLQGQIPARVIVKVANPQAFAPEGSSCQVGQSVKLTFSTTDGPQ